MTTSLGETASDEFGYKAWSEARKRGAKAFELASAAQYKEASAMLCDAILSGYANALEEIRLDLLADTVHDCIKHAAGQLAPRAHSTLPGKTHTTRESPTAQQHA